VPRDSARHAKQTIYREIEMQSKLELILDLGLAAVIVASLIVALLMSFNAFN